MICHKCGAKLPDNAIRCNKCGIKVNMVCPECKTLNRFGSHTCYNCGFELIKKCDKCGSSNIYSALECRKCHAEFNNNEKENLKEEIIKNSASEKVSQDVIQTADEIQEKANSVFENVYIQKEKAVPPEKQETPTISDMEVVLPFSCVQSSFTQVDSPLSKVKDKKDISEKLEKLGEDDYKQQFEEQKIFNLEEDNNPIAVKEEQDFESFIESQTTEQNDTDEVEVQKIDDLIDENIPINVLDEDTVSDNNEHTEVSQQEEELNDVVVDPVNLDSIEIQQEAVKKAVELIKKSITKHVIAINGNEGSGKSAVLRQVKNYFISDKYVVLYGSCTPLLQITSFGFFQDAFLRILGFPPYANSIEAFKTDFKKNNLENEFSFLSKKELSLFLNIFYPAKKDSFKNILENKKIIFGILEKVIKSFLLDNNIIIAIDNFELLDGASYDFILYMLKKGYFNNRLKLLVAYKEKKSLQSYYRRF